MADEKTGILIIGGGLTGLTLAFYLQKYQIPFKLLEKSHRLGGVIQTWQEDGFTFEAGPNTGVLATPEIAELIEELAGQCELEIADPKAKKRWIWKNGQWHALPSGLLKAVGTPLFTCYDKIRILAEPFRRKGNNPDETLAAIVRRRLGKSYLDYAVDPFISGVYAGDPEQLVTRFALPKLYNLEQQYGSFIKGAIQKKKEGKSEREKKATREVFSVKGGLSRLIEALSQSVPDDHIVLNAEKIEIQPAEIGYRACYKTNGEAHIVKAGKVISTTGASALPALMPFLPPGEAGCIAGASYAKVVQVVLGYKKWDGIPINAFGGLVPSVENQDILGVLFTSSFFSNRAPEHGCVLSVFMGGVRWPEVVERSDTDIERIVITAVKKMLKTDRNPDLLRIFRYEQAIPQYDITMKERLQAIESIEKTHPGVMIAGQVKDGIGMAHRVEQARNIAERMKANG